MSQAGSFASAIIPPGAGVLTLTAEVGGAILPDIAGNINIVGAHGINTSGAAHTITAAINNAIFLGDLAPIAPGGSALTCTTGDVSILSGDLNLPLTTDINHGVITINAFSFLHAYGTNNTFVGTSAGNFTTTGADSVGIGFSALQNVTTANANTAVGFTALLAITTGGFNVAIGDSSQGGIQTGFQNSSLGSGTLSLAVGAATGNTAIGYQALFKATTPAYNTAVGHLAGSNYLTNESKNITIDNAGVVADTGMIRIGTNPTHTKTFIAGIDGVDVGNTAKIVTMGTGATVDQLGTATLTAGLNITITPGPNTITIAAGAGVAGIQTLTGDAGGAILPDMAGNINIVGDHGITVVGDPIIQTLTASINNSIVLGDLAVIGPATDALTITTGDITISSGNFNLPTTGDADNGVITVNAFRFLHSYGVDNVFLGEQSGNFALTGSFNTAVGAQTLVNVTTGDNNSGLGKFTLANLETGSFNTALGAESLALLDSAQKNTAVGFGAIYTNVTGDNNTAVGHLALNLATAPVNNIAIGESAGFAYTTNESFNIIIGSVGVIADAGAIRIGTNATQTSCYVAGIDGVNVGNTAKIVTIGTGATQDQLGTATLTAGTNVTIVPTANTITINAIGSNNNGSGILEVPYGTFIPGIIPIAVDYYKGFGLDTSGVANDPTATQIPVPADGFIDRLYVNLAVPTPIPRDIYISLNVNGVNTALSALYPASSPSGIYFDITNIVSVSAGDLICIHISDATPHALSMYGSVAVRFRTLNGVFGFGSNIISMYRQMSRVGYTTYSGLIGNPAFLIQPQLAANLVQIPITTNGIISDFYWFGMSNDTGVSPTIYLNVNGINTALSINIPSPTPAMTLISNTVAAVNVLAGDLVCFKIDPTTDFTVAGSTSLKFTPT